MAEWAAQIIGINYYPEYTTLKPLTAAAEDAEKVAAQLEQYGYRPFRVSCLPGNVNQKGESKINPLGAVRVQELREAISNLFNPPPPNPIPETALFFFSGHGWCKTLAGEQEVFLATSDVYPDAEIYGIPLSWLGEQLQISRAKRVVVWLDCCYSGELLRYIPTDKDYCFITATRSYETGVEIPHTQGLLTQTLLAGLNPENDADGIINSHKLADFILRRMPDTVQRPLITNSPRAILLTTNFPPASFQDKCPYRSLAYFSETKEDAEVFYGRSALTKQLIQQIREQHRLVAVLGASGSGKSSLLRAGLLYQMKLGQEIPGSNGWTYITPFTPKENPVESLREAFSQVTPLNPTPDASSRQSRPTQWLPLERGETQQSNSLPLVRGGLGWGDFVYVIGEGLKALNTPVILIIDQFEECFTMSDDSQRQEFFDCLCQLIDCTDNLYIFIGMRSDFRGRWREYPEFASKIYKPYINVEHLKREEIEEAITKPADWVGLQLEGRLIQQLINDVEDYPESLPLLQYTLTQLWRESRNQGDQFLRLKTYQDLGGVEGTLQKRADAVFQSLSTTEQIVARRIFLELTQIGETTDVRRRVRLRELVNSQHSWKLLQQVSEKLADKDARLITKTDEPDTQNVILDVVHEALIRYWKQLRDWKEEYKVGILIERQIEAEAQDWQRNEKKPGFLRKDDRLAVAEAYLARFGDWQMLNGLAEEYIQASRELRNHLERDEKQRQQEKLNAARRQNRIVTLFSVGLTGVAIFAGFQWYNAQNKAREAALQTAIALAQTSEASLVSDRQIEAVVAAIQSGRLILGKSLRKDVKLEQTAEQQAVVALKRAIYNTQERNRLEEHSAAVYRVAFSPDGKTITSTTNDNTVKLWDAATGKLIPTLNAQSASSAFSPDGKTSASVSDDNSIKIWDVGTGKLISTLKGHRNAILSVIFSPNGKTIASASGRTLNAVSNENSIKIWNVATGKLISTINGDSREFNSGFSPVAFSPDGKTIASVSDDSSVKIWDVATGKLIFTLNGDSREFNSGFSPVAFSPDGKTIASVSGDTRVKLWDVATGKLISTLRGHSEWVFSVAFSPDSKTIASGSYDKSVILWDVATGKPISILNGHSSAVRDVAFSPDGKTIASASDDKSVKLWDVATGKPISILNGHSGWVWGVAFSPDDKTVASASWDKSVKLWDVATGKVISTLNGHSREVNSVAFSPDGKTIASASDDRSVKLWDIATGKPILTLNGHSQRIWSVAFSPDGKTIASASDDSSVKLWDVATGKPILTLNGHSSVAFSPDGKTIASASDDSSVKLWDVATGKPILTLNGHKEGISSVAFSPDGKTIASASYDNSVKLWDVATGKPILTLDGHRQAVFSIAFSPDGKTIVSAGTDKSVKLWDVATGKPISTLNGHTDGIRGVAFSPDGKIIVSGGTDNSVILWKAYPNSLEDLIVYSCARLRGYLQSNPNVSDKHLCDGISVKSK
ncbi:PQQ-binding-like beta-propeller repeat protein [Nostoc sp. FACHB-110]|uniref:nSTAND1 domain-containing NTPase n=1 Tax=Nostoc sp. FACHB-110 TaxID=2692834 RepID=UPI0016863025|nr:PQQ-binding-like beta-propeller repeat protein [Nostoc sp. FACHB-110]MBD2441572.1 PQQ-binding-like beta-propeller repeat protein [Nostoc sp. FACHB-110]